MLLRSTLRVIAVTLAAFLVLYGATWLAITQPFPAKKAVQFHGNAMPDALERHVRFLAIDCAPRHYRNAEKLRAAAEYIEKAFRDAGASVEAQRYTAGGTEQQNVIARIGPAGPPKVIVGAHYDACGLLPGADDNASGVAGLLELARLLPLQNPTAPVELVAYSTEEPPFFGSSEMGSAKHAMTRSADRADVAVMISLEMIGYYVEEQPAPSWPLRLLYPRKGDFVLVAGRWSDRSLVGTIKSAMRSMPGIKVQSYCGPTGIGTDLSDQRNYWAVGVSAVMITDTAFIRNPNYHTPGDKADTLNYSLMARTVDGVGRAIIALLNEPGKN